LFYSLSAWKCSFPLLKAVTAAIDATETPSVQSSLDPFLVISHNERDLDLYVWGPAARFVSDDLK